MSHTKQLSSMKTPGSSWKDLKRFIDFALGGTLLVVGIRLSAYGLESPLERAAMYVSVSIIFSAGVLGYAYLEPYEGDDDDTDDEGETADDDPPPFEKAEPPTTNRWRR